MLYYTKTTKKENNIFHGQLKYWAAIIYYFRKGSFKQLSLKQNHANHILLVNDSRLDIDAQVSL